MAAYQRKFHISTTAGMRLNHHGNFKIQRFQLFEQIKKDGCTPSPIVPHLPLPFSFQNTSLQFIVVESAMSSNHP